MSADPVLATNPFPRRPADLGAHYEGCAGPERRDGYIPFPKRPEPPEVSDGGVVLIGGRPHLGKSVLAHRCLHRYESSGHLPVDLSGWPPTGLTGPADCLARMRESYPLPQEVRAAFYDVRQVRSADLVLEHHELGRALAGRRLVVRLPRPDPSLRPPAVAEQVLAYVRAARALNSSIYLFEFPYWADDDWTEVRDLIARNPQGDAVAAVGLEPFSDVELMEFLRARVGAETSLDRLFDLDMGLLLQSLALQRASVSPNNLTWFNVLCHQAFAAAIGAGASRVAIHHFLAAAVRIGAP
ncbi:hypothetical protein E1200_15505 [Actinomadura sp. GC306]|uniref:hypothetical protein n=1 Tax=Actinomadura sp. GC306 TaxID=2530367 RepID=UPI0010505E11|nr:hypothetical protein [Actinomadura sp. GC306]TDC67149.1 hypothetical protein E1200_15505 [Actinomadura sp. GC306]